MKLDRGKEFEKQITKKFNTCDNIYFGAGKEGLEENEDKENNIQIYNETVTKVPIFSEGYFDNELIINDNLLNLDDNDDALPIEMMELDTKENDYNKNNLKDSTAVKANISTINTTNNNLSNLKDIKNTNFKQKRNITPLLFTNHLKTAIKTSKRKHILLDTELKHLSNEFKNLLSNKKLPQIEKRLDFTEQKNNNNLNVIKEEPEPHQDLNDEEVKELENEILTKVLEENFGFNNFLFGQLNTIKSILNGKVRNIFKIFRIRFLYLRVILVNLCVTNFHHWF